jgi:hypothetical protein
MKPSWIQLDLNWIQIGLISLNLIQFNQIQFNWNFNKNMNHANPKKK